jgi:recombinational DNA repair protein (RecF pathway)
MQEIITGIVVKRVAIKEKDIRATILTESGLRIFNVTGHNKAQLFSHSEFTIASHKIIKEHVHDLHFGITKNYNHYLRACKVCQEILDTIPYVDSCDFDAARDEFVNTLKVLRELSCPTV